MKIDTLVEMANQIGDFFASMPDRDQATMDVASHLKRFWAPPMRRQLMDYARQPAADDLMPIVRDAASRHADLIL
jgi:formate dehydrogenase subunit delta